MTEELLAARVARYEALHASGAPLVRLPADERDYTFGSLAANNEDAPFEWDLSQLPANFDLRPYEDFVKDQLSYNSCVGNAQATQAELYKSVRGQQVVFSRLFPYYNARALTSDTVTDAGSSISHSIAELTALGICSEAAWPYSSPVNARPSAAAYAEARTHLLSRYENVGRNIIHWDRQPPSIGRNPVADAMVAIYCKSPVIFGIPVNKKIFGVTGPLETHPAQFSPRTGDPDLIGYHAMAWIGWRTVAGRIIFITENSWGPGWGDGGFLGMDQNSLYAAFDMYAFRSFDGLDASIPFSLYRWTADCDLKDGTSVSIQPAAAQLYRLYKAAFGRTPDLPGLGWNYASMQAGTALRDVASFFLASPEYHALYGDTADAQFLTLLYRNVLGREPDADGFAWWLSKLIAGQPRVDVLLGFSESAECVANTPTKNGVRYVKP